MGKVARRRRETMAYQQWIQQLQQQWQGRRVRFTLPFGTGIGVVYCITNDGDVIVAHADYERTGLPAAIAFSVHHIQKFLVLVDEDGIC